MRPIARGIAALATALAIAACSGAGTATTAPGGGGTQLPAATSAGSAPCADSSDPTVVDATVVNRTWTPPTVNAKVGDVITWTNGDSVPHAVALDDGSCAMSSTIPGGGKASLVFSVAGTFPFHCSVHPTMKGTIVIS